MSRPRRRAGWIGCREYCCCASCCCTNVEDQVNNGGTARRESQPSKIDHCHDHTDQRDPSSPNVCPDTGLSLDQCSRLKRSYVGQAAFDALKLKHFWQRSSLWNASTGIVTDIHYTPKQSVVSEDALPPNHSDWLPEHLGELLAKTESWLDITNLGPPDGLFLEHVCLAIKKLHEKNKPIIIRILFGNILGMPVNCEAVLKRLTEVIPADKTKLRIWLGAWRKGVSWNHSKIVAVDGKHLWTGGHNWWDGHYLKHNPVHDISVSLEGRVAQDAHEYANEQWHFIERMGMNVFGRVINIFPDWAPMALKCRVTIRRFPKLHEHNYNGDSERPALFQRLSHSDCPRFPPTYYRPENIHRILDNKFKSMRRFSLISKLRHSERASDGGNQPPAEEVEASPPPSPSPAPVGRVIPIITMGRYGKVTRFGHRPSDDAMVSMLDSAKSNIKLALQDIGPVCVPGTKVSLPGCVWPKSYLNAFGRALYSRQVKIQLILSNPLSIPGGLTIKDACYGNGWSCVDVAAEIMKTIQEQFPNVRKLELWRIAKEQLQVSFVRGSRGKQWEDGMKMGLHSKHFIVDDRCCYIGSQNLYVCDLAEWGVVIDDAEETEKVLRAFWNPLWEVSYEPEDCHVPDVMDGLEIDRDGVSDPELLSDDIKKSLVDSVRNIPGRGYREFGCEGSIYIPDNHDSFYLEAIDELLEEGKPSQRSTSKMLHVTNPKETIDQTPSS